MPDLSANLSWLFTELALMDRFRAAKEAGFDAVAVDDPYDAPVQDMRDQLVWNTLKMVAINCPPPNYTGGAPGYAAVPGSRFQQDFKRTLRYAQALKSVAIHVQVGGADGDTETLTQNLRWAAGVAGKMMLTIAPTPDAPYLRDYAQTRTVLTAVQANNVRLLLDTVIARQVHGDDLLALWAEVGDLVGHVQVAQHPDRSEPVGEGIDFASFFARLAADGYTGPVTAAYHPATTTQAGLGWISAYT